MKGIFPIDKFRTLQTPFYYYDTKVLRDTLSAINQEVAKYPSYSVHYAVKANANPKVLTIIRESGMGADCVSGGEIRAAVRAGFPANKIVFAGVGKADWEINLGLEYGIFCFNVESIPELEVINELAAAQNKIANVAFRINPDVGAHTHANITTGLAENKFGIRMQDMDRVIDVALEMKNVKFIGLHFHIGSQILDMGDFIALCNRVNELQDKLEARRILVEHINVGGGLGIDYGHPNRQSVPDFKSYFATYTGQLKLRPYQTFPFTVDLQIPQEYEDKVVDLMTKVEQLQVQPDQLAKVVIDESSGIIVIGKDVKINRLAIAQGNLTIKISEIPMVSQPLPFSNGTTVTQNVTAIDVNEEVNSRLSVLDTGVNLQELVDGLNALGVTPRDLISILQAVKASGALQADIEVI